MSPLVLVVEDDPDNRLAVEKAVQYMLGYRVSLADNGEEAIRMAREEKPDVILMDMDMPVMDGWEAAGILKGMDDLRDVPIIALTAHAMVGEREKAIGAGCDDFMSKPIDLMGLVALIERYLGKVPVRPNGAKSSVKVNA